MYRLEGEPEGYKRPPYRKGGMLAFRKWAVWAGTLLSLLAAIFLICTLADNREARSPKSEVAAVRGYTAQVADYLIYKPVQTAKVSDKPEETVAQPKKTEMPVSRDGDRAVMMIMECTAYTLRPEECGKSQNDPWYGITAACVPVKPWHTVAADKSISFGTRLYIPFFKDKPNKGIFYVEDRGGAVTEGCIDIYMESLDEAMRFGRRDLEVYVLDE